MIALDGPDWTALLELGLLGRLLLATLLGGAIGLERELSGKPAGLRTNILICVGAALLMEISVTMARFAAPGMPSDPGRIAAQVVSGIGFIGAGTILVFRGHVVGLTTAATLWVVAAIGLAVGAGAYVQAIGTTALVAFTLVVLSRIEDWIERRRALGSFELSLAPSPDAVRRVEAAFAAEGLRAVATRMERTPEEIRMAYEVRGSARGREAALRRLGDDPEVRRVSVS